MFKRIIYEEWHTVVPVIGFILTASAFILILLRAFFTKKDKINHMSHLPLEQDDQPASINPHEKKVHK